MTIDGKKFDLRMHLLMVGAEPTFCYAFRDGVARLCTHEYQKPTRENMADVFMHISNVAIQKKSETFTVDPKTGTKRAFSDFIEGLRERDASLADTVEANLKECFTQTMTACIPFIQAECETHLEGPISARHRAHGFHVLGVDVVVDEEGKCWVVEINSLPALNTISRRSPEDPGVKNPVDIKVKKPLMDATVDIVLQYVAEGIPFLETL
jgi:hypothetical protein